MPGDQRPRISATDATIIKDFYLVKMADGTVTDRAETAFGVLESPAVEAIRTLLDRGTWPIPVKLREDIAAWAALQFLRAPWIRGLGREMAHELRSAGLPVLTHGGSRVVVYMDDEGYTEVTRPDLHPRFIGRQLRTVVEMLYNRDWIITIYKLPIALLRATGHRDGVGIGVANAGEIFLPIDRRVGLTMTPDRTR